MSCPDGMKVNGKQIVVTVNGVTLNDAQVIGFHCALNELIHTMSKKGCLGDDEHGEYMRQAYAQRAREILNLYMN